jgi:hypothetical protein
MSEWMAIAQWHECAKMARPGIIFELRNEQGQSLFTRCVAALPAIPSDWAPAVRFRAVAEPKPEHSAPIPSPRR